MKSLTDEQIDLKCDNYPGIFLDPDNKKAAIHGFRDGLKEARDHYESQSVSQPQWIDVKERLPESIGRYIVYYGTDDDMPFLSKHAVCYWNREAFSTHSAIKPVKGVTHWMPLPEPPKP